MSLRNANTCLSSSSLHRAEDKTCSGRLDVGEGGAASESDSLSNKNAKSLANSRSSCQETPTHNTISTIQRASS